MKKVIIALITCVCSLAFLHVGSLFSLSFDNGFLKSHYLNGGSIHVDRNGNIHYLWISRNNNGKHCFYYQQTNSEGEHITAEIKLAEIGPARVNKTTSIVSNRNGEIYGFWNLGLYTDVITAGAPENYNPLFGLLSVNVPNKEINAAACTTLAFNHEEFLLEADQHDTIWAIGRTPGAQIWGLVFARIFPDPSEEYTRIGPRKLYAPGLRKGIIGFTINSENEFLLCDRMHRKQGEARYNDTLLSCLIDKKGKSLREPIEIDIEESAIKIIPSTKLSDIRKPIQSIFTHGMRLANFGKDKIYAMVVYKEKIYIIGLQDDGVPYNSGDPQFVEPKSLPKEWNSSIRLWTHFDKGPESDNFYIFGIDSAANFYWECIPID